MSTTVREDYEVGDLDPAGVLEAAAAAERAERQVAFRKLQLAAHWADLHPATTDTGVETFGGPALVATMSVSHVLLIGGRAGVGKSTVAAEMHRQLSKDGIQHAWIEGDNLGMAYPVPWKQGHHLAEANLAAMWANYKVLGYSRLIYVNTASVLGHVIDSLTTAMGDAPNVSGVLLTSSDEVAEQRLVQREVGGGLHHALGRSREAALELEASAPAEVIRLETDGRSVTELATEVIQLSGWYAT